MIHDAGCIASIFAVDSVLLDATMFRTLIACG
jgi:hypothetical protein